MGPDSAECSAFNTEAFKSSEQDVVAQSIEGCTQVEDDEDGHRCVGYLSESGFGVWHQGIQGFLKGRANRGSGRKDQGQVFCRVVPIPIPVSEMSPILPKMLVSVSASTGVQAPPIPRNLLK